MENCLDRFAYIRVLRGLPEMGLYLDGMRNNYNLEDAGDAYLKYLPAAKWEEQEPARINDMPIGTVFIGISKTDSMARTYVVVAKDGTTKESVWYPFGGFDDAEPVIVVYEFDMESKKFTKLFTTELAGIEAKLDLVCKPGKFYVTTNINNELVPIFDGVDIDDDEWSEDEDDDDDWVDDAVESDDEEEDDDFTTADCVFTVFEDTDGSKTYTTVSKGLLLEDQIAESEHVLHHALENLADATKHAEKAKNLVDYNKACKAEFDKSFAEFQSAIGSNGSLEMDNPLNIFKAEEEEEVKPVEHKPAEISIPKSSDEIEVQKTELTSNISSDTHEEVKGDPDGELIVPSPSKYLPKDDEVAAPKTTEPQSKDEFGDW